MTKEQAERLRVLARSWANEKRAEGWTASSKASCAEYIAACEQAEAYEAAFQAALDQLTKK